MIRRKANLNYADDIAVVNHIPEGLQQLNNSFDSNAVKVSIDSEKTDYGN